MEEPLGYERRSGTLSRRRYAFVLVVVILFCAIFYYRTGIVRAVRVAYLVRECKSIALSSKVIGLEVCSVEFAKQHPPSQYLSEKVDAVGVVRRPATPPCLSSLAAWLGLHFDARYEAVLYVGERLTPSGGKRLVIILRPFDSRDFDGFSANFRALVIRNDQILRISAVERPCWTPDNVTLEHFDSFSCVTFFDAISDPNERNRIAIPYEADGKSGWIDGWLQDDESVTFKFRDGPGYSKDGGPRT